MDYFIRFIAILPIKWLEHDPISNSEQSKRDFHAFRSIWSPVSTCLSSFSSCAHSHPDAAFKIRALLTFQGILVDEIWAGFKNSEGRCKLGIGPKSFICSSCRFISVRKNWSPSVCQGLWEVTFFEPIEFEAVFLRLTFSCGGHFWPHNAMQVPELSRNLEQRRQN